MGAENGPVAAKGEGKERDGRESGVSRCKLLHLEWTGSEVLLDGTGT